MDFPKQSCPRGGGVLALPEKPDRHRGLVSRGRTLQMLSINDFLGSQDAGGYALIRGSR
jgi:hypothetical protein